MTKWSMSGVSLMAGASQSKVTERSKVAEPTLVVGPREVDEPSKAAKRSEAAQRSKAAVIVVLKIVFYIAVICAALHQGWTQRRWTSWKKCASWMHSIRRRWGSPRVDT